MADSPPQMSSRTGAAGGRGQTMPGHESEETKPISQLLRELCDQPDQQVSVREIVDKFGRRAFGAVMFVFSAPNLLPLPPGASTVLGAPLVLLAPQVALGVRAPWLPKTVARRDISLATFKAAIGRWLPWLERIERASRPRLSFLFGSVGDRLIGLVCTTLALVLILPIPLGNMLPAASVAVLSLALALRDGALAIAGYLLAAASVAVLVLTAGALTEGVRRLLEMVGA
jgi:hypothetical protein